MREYYQKNKEAIKKRASDYYEANKEEVLRKQKPTRLKYYQKNKLKISERNKKRWKKQRVALLKQVGYGVLACKRCGFDDYRALQVDHVNGGGQAEVRNTKFRNPERYAKHIAKNPKNYQLLCANCNWIKRDENQEYPKR